MPSRIANFLIIQNTLCAVAVKRLIHKKGEDIAREADVLRGLSGGSHPNDHLISLLATFEYNGGFYLIFPLAEADLQRFWKRSKTCTDPNTGRWMIEQSLGIASALYKIHRYETFPRTSSLYKANHTRKSTMARQELSSILEGDGGNPGRRLFGRHGDIKPNNILVFPDRNSANRLGTLKIADFGITQFGTEDMRWLKEGEKVSCTRTYQSPECVLDKSISTACDIWALGCLYLEFVLWYLRGFKAVVAFSRARDRGYGSDTFFDRIGQDELTAVPIADIKPCVAQVYRSQFLRITHHRLTHDS
jgi:serine/threonine protein kinase